MSPLATLRERLCAFHRPASCAGVLPFGVPALDAQLPEGGLRRGALHELAGEAGDIAPTTLFVAGLLARLKAPVLWCATTPDLFAPGLAAAGLAPARVLHAWLDTDVAVLAAMEEALRHPGLGAVVGELRRLTLTQSRRLVLSAEKTGVMALALRRPRAGDAAPAPTAAATRWRVTPLPSAPLPHPGIGRARWRVALERCRGGEPATWIMEACDAQGYLALAAAFPGGARAPAAPRAA